jgi:ribonuclease T2
MRSVLLALLLATPALAQAPACRIGGDLPNARLVKVDWANPSAPVDSYTLALSWSPEFCASPAGKRPANDHQCQDNVFGWVVHGLWPQRDGARSKEEHPRFCRRQSQPLSAATVRAHVCTIPGVQLMQAQWEKHGSCAFTSAERYFAVTEQLWRGLRLPDAQQLAGQRGAVQVGALRAAISKANPAFRADGIFVALDDQDRLDEIRLCYDRSLRPTRCERRGAPDRLSARVTPRPR